jgi:hypothetical protein
VGVGTCHPHIWEILNSRAATEREPQDREDGEAGAATHAGSGELHCDEILT